MTTPPGRVEHLPDAVVRIMRAQRVSRVTAYRYLRAAERRHELRIDVIRSTIRYA